MGSSESEIEAIIQAFRDEVENRMHLEQIGHYETILEKVGRDIPDDIQFQIYDAKEFSKTVKKKCGEKSSL